MACCACLKQKSSISLGAAEAGVTLINDKKMDPPAHILFSKFCFLRVVVGFSFHHDAPQQSSTLKPPSSASMVHGGRETSAGHLAYTAAHH